MDLLEKNYKLGNSKNQKAFKITLETALVGEDGTHRSPTKLGSIVRETIFEVYQAPFGDSYALASSEKICLMLMQPPTITCLPGGEGFKIEGCTFETYITKTVSDKDLAKRMLRDFIQPGTKLDITVGQYHSRSEAWKECFGGYFLPVNFSRSTNLPFDPKDMAYLNPKRPGASYMNSSREIRIALLRGYVDRFGIPSSISQDIVEVRSDSLEVLEVVRQIAKSLGYLAGPLDQPQTYGVLVSSSLLGQPANAYPIKVKELGEIEWYSTPGEFRVILDDGTVCWW